MTEGAIQERKQALEEYLNALMKTNIVLDTPHFKEFLEIPDVI